MALTGVVAQMITGDHLLIARETAKRLGMGNNILPSHKLHESKGQEKLQQDLVMNADGFAEVFPDDKFNIVAIVQSTGRTTGMTGDGVNDAPGTRPASRREPHDRCSDTRSWCMQRSRRPSAALRWLVPPPQPRAPPPWCCRRPVCR
jgi:cation transport ATPase